MMAAEAFKVEFHVIVVWLIRFSSGPKGRMFEVGGEAGFSPEHIQSIIIIASTTILV